jgi:hypothetical protein
LILSDDSNQSFLFLFLKGICICPWKLPLEWIISDWISILKSSEEMSCSWIIHREIKSHRILFIDPFIHARMYWHCLHLQSKYLPIMSIKHFPHFLLLSPMHNQNKYLSLRLLFFRQESKWYASSCLCKHLTEKRHEYKGSINTDNLLWQFTRFIQLTWSIILLKSKSFVKVYEGNYFIS